MNDEIFRGAAVLEAVAEVDLDAADTADALDPRQFGLAFLQRAMGAIPLARDIFQVLPQPFGSRRLGKCVGTVSRSHARLSGIFT